MLEIRFPGVVLNECFMQQQPRTGPPALLKLDNRNHSGHQTSLPHNRSVGERQETEITAINSDNRVSEINTRQPSNSADNSFPPCRNSEDPDNDPLNTPDFYFLPANSSKYEQKSISNGISLLVGIYFFNSLALYTYHWWCIVKVWLTVTDKGKS